MLFASLLPGFFMVFSFHLLVSLRHATITVVLPPRPPRGLFFLFFNKAVRFDLAPRLLADALTASRLA